MSTIDIKQSYISTRTLAYYLGVSESTLLRLRINGTGPKYCRIGRSIRYGVADLRTWLEDNQGKYR